MAKTYQFSLILKTILFGHSVCVFLWVLSLIDTDLLRLVTENFSAANIQFTGQALSFITSKMGDVAMDLAIGTKTMKELWST